MLVTDLVNVRYLSGFTGSNAALLIRRRATTRRCWPPTGATGPRPPQQSPDAEVVIERAVCAAPGGTRGRLGRAAARLREPRRDRRRPRAAEEGARADVELVRAAGTVEALREVKDAGEIALLRLACEAADAALADLVAAGGLRPGRTEKEVGRDLESRMLDHGADGVSFETIVAAGAELGDPAPPADRRRARGG